MAGRNFVLHVSWFVLALSHGVVGSLNLGVSQPTISPGITRDMTINCTFSFSGASNISSMISMILFNDNKELVSISIYSGQVNELSKSGGIPSGHIGSQDNSFLALFWNSPSGDNSGLYRCKAFGVDNIGRPAHLSATARVTTKMPDIIQLIEHLITLQTELAKVMKRMDIQERRLTDTVTILFWKSDVYQGRHYFLSKEDWSKSENAEAMCQHLGGYLAEIDNAAEHSFINKFVNGRSGLDGVLVGATDAKEKGHWIFGYSGRDLVYTSWAPKEPGSGDDCMEIFRPYGWKMSGIPCSPNWQNRRFLCEVPQ